MLHRSWNQVVWMVLMQSVDHNCAVGADRLLKWSECFQSLFFMEMCADKPKMSVWKNESWNELFWMYNVDSWSYSISQYAIKSIVKVPYPVSAGSAARALDVAVAAVCVVCFVAAVCSIECAIGFQPVGTVRKRISGIVEPALNRITGARPAGVIITIIYLFISNK